MTHIEFGNGVSQVFAPPDVLATIRHHVAYQAAPMPPVLVQTEIRRYFTEHMRIGGLGDAIVVCQDPRVRWAMEQTDFEPEDLTTKMLEATIRANNVWDGWTSMVSERGVFGSGLLHHVQRALEVRCQVQYTTIDQRGSRPEPRYLIKPPPLRDYQQAAVDAVLAHGRGVLDLPPRSGKTRIALALCCILGLRAVYIAPTVGIARQTVAAFKKHLPGGMVALGTGGKQSGRQQRLLNDAMILVATPLTFLKLPGVRSRQVLIIDEFHHAAADTWQTINRETPTAFWRIGLTGTHFRADGRDLEMAAVLGRAIYRQSVTDIVVRGHLTPARIAMLRVRGLSPAHDTRSNGWYAAGVVEHADRNNTLTWAARELLARGRRVLCIVKEIRHGEAIQAQIPGSIFVSGEDNDAVEAALEDMRQHRVQCVIGTSVIGEGRDVPAADALVYFAGLKSRVKVTQDYYRVLTPAPGKDYGIIIDAADTHHGILASHAAERLLLYRSERAFEADVMEWRDLPAWLDR